MGKPSTTVVGSKVAVLTAEAVYNVAHRRTTVEPDSSSLEQSVLKKPKPVTILPSDAAVLSVDMQCLPDAEVRATLVVLLHKLLLGPPGSRKFLPIFITEVLNSRLILDIPESRDDSAVIQAFVGSIYRIGERVASSGDVPLLDEPDKEVVSVSEASPSEFSKLSKALEKAGAGAIGVTEDEVVALENSLAASTGIAALAAYSLKPLAIVADAVAALSCEALRANTDPFASDYFKQAFIRKSEADVASDLNSLLSGSKLVNARKGGVDAECIRNVPAAHGALREAVKLLASRLRVEMNRVSSIFEGKTSLAASSPSGTALFSLFTSTLLPLLVSLWPSICGSFERTSKSLECIQDGPESDGLLKDWVDESIEVMKSLKQSLQDAGTTAAVSGDENAVFLSKVVLSTVEAWRRAICKESTSALSLLCIRERDFGHGRVEEQDSGDRKETNARPKGAAPARAAKGKNNFVLGKGTGTVRQSLARYLKMACANDDAARLEPLSIVEKKLNVLLNPQIREFEGLVAEVKTVLEGNEIRRLPKIAKGTRDFKPEQMVIREKAFGIVSAIFKRHGAVELETPVFELKETLMGKYGEDSKLIYDLADQGGEILSLRYDLTVPFARYLAMSRIENLKRYHIARVYRRDNPAKGRYREFYQCDFDIAGQYAPMVPDFEVLKVLTELLNELDIGDYEIKLNHRKLLDGMLEICGVPQAKFRSICSAIDKLDKLPWEEVHREMVEEKGLTQEVADKIGKLVQKRGIPLDLLKELNQMGSPFLEHRDSTVALDDLGVLFNYLKASKCMDRIVFDLSLARGLDYYTGVIYEAVLKGSNQVGSIAAGGRYDNLVGMFGSKQVPAVGVSLGIERVFTIMEKQLEDRKRVERANQTEVLVVVLGKDVEWTQVGIDIVSDLWDGGLKAEFAVCPTAKLAKQMTRAKTSGIPYVIIAGEDEVNGGILQLKTIPTGGQEEIPRNKLVVELQRRRSTFTLSTELEVLPESFGELRALQTLSICHCNNLEVLPASFVDLQALKTLEISSCLKLGALPEDFGKLKALGTLKISGCPKLGALPEGFGNLRVLRTLVIDGCCTLERLPQGFGELGALETLEISASGELGELPMSFGELRALGTLKISSCPKLGALPKNFGMLLALETLEISKCLELGDFPEGFGNLLALKTLVIDHFVHMEWLPESLGQCGNLKRLVIDDCQKLEGLPESLGMLSVLETLVIRDCVILKRLPDSIGELQALQSLSISNFHNLAVLPSSFGQLKALQRLSISYCEKLHILPDSFGQLQALQRLSISHCEKLHILPDSFGQLQALETLEISFCPKLEALPLSFGNLRALQTLVIDGCLNQKSLHDSLGGLRALQTLEMKNCPKLLKLPENIAELSALQTLKIQRSPEVMT